MGLWSSKLNHGNGLVENGTVSNMIPDEAEIVLGIMAKRENYGSSSRYDYVGTLGGLRKEIAAYDPHKAGAWDISGFIRDCARGLIDEIFSVSITIVGPIKYEIDNDRLGALIGGINSIIKKGENHRYGLKGTKLTAVTVTGVTDKAKKAIVKAIKDSDMNIPYYVREHIPVIPEEEKNKDQE